MTKSCLLVDDEASIRDTLPPVLTAAGFTVETVENVERARARLVSRRFDLVITDLRLAGPGDRGGFGVILASKLLCAATPVVVLTAFAGADAARAARELGADGFWSKSMPIPELVRQARELAGAPAEATA